MNRRVLFLYPPHARNTEPPLGAALLASLLRSCGAEARVLDLNAGAAAALALDRGSSAGWAKGGGRHQADPEQLILDGIGRLQPLGQNRALVSIRELRRDSGLSRKDFDGAVFSLAHRGRVILHQHDFPASLDPAEREQLLRDERGTYDVGIVPKEMS